MGGVIMAGRSKQSLDGKKGTKTVRIKTLAEVKDAQRSLRELERQVDKLGDLADQGSKRQDGFLSSRQVDMYRKILKEMEKTYSEHTRNLQNLQDKYDKQKKSKEAQELQRLKENISKREALLKNAEGNNKWGDVASPVIQEYHRNKLSDAVNDFNNYKKSADYRRYETSLAETEHNLRKLSETVQKLDVDMERSKKYTQRIDDMHEWNPQSRRLAQGMANTVASTGAITSFGSYWNYTQSGIDILRQQELQANTVTLRGGINMTDRKYRNSIYDLGESSNYDVGQTAQLQGVLISGGTTGDTKSLARDTKAVQRFSRSYALDANSVGMQAAAFQRMGTFSEGQQRRFAEMIAGAISKEGMNGRQEEMLQSVMSLAQSVASGQAQYTQKQFSTVLNTQTALGKAVPTLKGEAGSQLLSTIDANIKSGGQQLDLLMGKGTTYTGLHGMTKLEEMKEQGISNPKNLQTILNNADKMFGGNEDMTKWALKEQLGLNMNEYDALKKSGLLDTLKNNPESITSKDLAEAGATELSKQWKKYQDSQTGTVNYLDSQSTDLKAKNAKGADTVAKESRSLFHGLGDIADIGLLAAGGLGLAGAKLYKGGKLIKGLTNGTRRIFSSRIGGPTKPGGTGGSGGIVDGIKNLGSRGTKNIPGGVSRSMLSRGIGAASGEILGEMGYRVPVAGALIGTVANKSFNPNESWGRSLAKGIGGTIGGLLGGVGATASGFFTGGLGWLGIGAASVGGGYAGEKAGDWLYSLFAGKDDATSHRVKSDSVPITPPNTQTSTHTTQTSTTTGAASLDTLAVNKITINNKELSSYFNSTSNTKKTDVSTAKHGRDNTMNININISGKIDGMNDDNQDTVSSSIKDYFGRVLSPYNSPFKYNLGLDLTRRTT